jgi:6-pyruvoyltetrahydropterin/6-carboxytetrahydropterin synthase
MPEFYKVTKRLNVEYGHRVPNHKSKCRSLHGHRGVIEVDIVGPLVEECNGVSDSGMVRDFADIKRAMEMNFNALFDHKTILKSDDDILAKLAGGVDYVRPVPFRTIEQGDTLNRAISSIKTHFADLTIVPFSPTAENLARLCYDVMVAEGFSHDVYQVRFWETETSVAAYPAYPKHRE